MELRNLVNIFSAECAATFVLVFLSIKNLARDLEMTINKDDTCCAGCGKTDTSVAYTLGVGYAISQQAIAAFTNDATEWQMQLLAAATSDSQVAQAKVHAL